MNQPLHAAQLMRVVDAALEDWQNAAADGRLTSVEKARMDGRFDDIRGWTRVVLTSQQLQQAMSRSTDPDRIAALAAALSYALASVG